MGESRGRVCGAGGGATEGGGAGSLAKGVGEGQGGGQGLATACSGVARAPEWQEAWLEGAGEAREGAGCNSGRQCCVQAKLS